MITNIKLENPGLIKPPDLYYQQCFRSIDSPIPDFRQHFQISMLRIGRILTEKGVYTIDMSAAQVVKAMDKHRNLMCGNWTPLKLREALDQHHEGEIVGGGIRVEYYALNNPHNRNSAPHFSITFSQIQWPKTIELADELCSSTSLQITPT